MAFPKRIGCLLNLLFRPSGALRVIWTVTGALRHRLWLYWPSGPDHAGSPGALNAPQLPSGEPPELRIKNRVTYTTQRPRFGIRPVILEAVPK